MFCTKCGNPNDDNAWKCVKCGQPLEHVLQQGQDTALKVHNYLIPAILTTLCCCVPFGIVAIVYAAQVNTKVAAANIEGAQESSRKAKMWCWVAFGVGLVTTAAWIIIQVFTAVASAKK